MQLNKLEKNLIFSKKKGLCKKVDCFKKVDSTFCGDGIVEEGEECDCGTVLQCIAARSCCGPPTGSKNKPPCQIFSHQGCLR